jgi:hypothetical protein
MSYNANGLAQTNGSVVFYGNTRSASSGGGGGLSQLVIVTAEDFAEETITLTNANDGTTLTKTADANGVAKFNVSSAGTWTATADDSGTTVTLGSVTLNVSKINYASAGVKFAFHYSEKDSEPDSVTYPIGYDNSNWSTAPAHMDFANNRFEYGAWNPDGANASKLRWLFPKPCMLAYDGTVSYYLDKNDYTKKTNGTASDVANTSFGGNAMMEWGQNGNKIWWKIVPDGDGKGFTFCVANYEVDAGYHCWNHYDCDNTIKDHFYTPIYFGSLVSSKLRSLSGQSNSVSKTRQQEIDYAKANNPDANVHWYTEVYADWLLQGMLTTLITKSLDSQTKIGKGRTSSGNTSAINTGTMNTRGLFWGSNNGTDGVKCWGMENPWGNLNRAVAGYVNINNTVKTKLTYGTADGTSASTYNLDGSGYTSMGTISGTSEGYISHMSISTKGISPATVSGSDSTYYTDGCWFTSGTKYAFVGGSWEVAARGGMFCNLLHADYTYAANVFGASISYK